ncbi:hypothetical protein C8R44DRAFT_941824 [Mycena epipterygia]|nr:hypothetical protein C8R44DRAFT_941824 [Mycena epipterygia]
MACKWITIIRQGQGMAQGQGIVQGQGMVQVDTMVDALRALGIDDEDLSGKVLSISTHASPSQFAAQTTPSSVAEQQTFLKFSISKYITVRNTFGQYCVFAPGWIHSGITHHASMQALKREQVAATDGIIGLGVDVTFCTTTKSAYLVPSLQTPNFTEHSCLWNPYVFHSLHVLALHGRSAMIRADNGVSLPPSATGTQRLLERISRTSEMSTSLSLLSSVTVSFLPPNLPPPASPPTSLSRRPSKIIFSLLPGLLRGGARAVDLLLPAVALGAACAGVRTSWQGGMDKGGDEEEGKLLQTANLKRLREELVKHWFTCAATASVPTHRLRRTTTVLPVGALPVQTMDVHDVLSSVLVPNGPIVIVPRPSGSTYSQPTVLGGGSRGGLRGSAPLARTSGGSSNTQHRASGTSSVPEASTSSRPAPATAHRHRPPVTPRASTSSEAVHECDEAESDDDEALVREFNAEGANAEELLGYDSESDDSDEDNTSEGESAGWWYQNAAGHGQGLGRLQSDRTQKGNIEDGVVDEHSLLLFIKYNAEREKLSRRGVPIPNTRLGASQLKKLFFGALRIRKEQDAANKTLVQLRPAATFIVWEAIKNQMDESLERLRNGLDETEDAPDIRANTFLSEVTDEQLQLIGYGFLDHRQCKINYLSQGGKY